MKTGFISTPQSRTRLREVFDVRYAIAQIIRRDFTVRYRQTLLGWLWAVFNPALSLAMYMAVFSLIMGIRNTEYSAPYWAVLTAGILYWNVFAASLNAVGDSLVNNAHLMKKIWFPRIIFGVAGLAVACVDFGVGAILFAMALWLTGHLPGLSALWVIPLTLICTVLTGFGAGCLIAILKIRFRDFRHLVPLLLQALFYASAVVYTPALAPGALGYFFVANPVSNALMQARHALFHGAVSLPSLFCLLLASGCIAAIGWTVFTYYERRVMDGE